MIELADGKVKLLAGDCVELLKTLPENSIDSVVTDAPYHLTSIVKRFKDTSIEDENITGVRSKNRADGYARLAGGFMGKAWDGGDVAFKWETWAEVIRVLKPGGHMLAFGGTRTNHRMACAIEDAGFEIRDMFMWVFATGFPKSHNIALAIDKTLEENFVRGKAFNMKGRGDRAEEFDVNGREFLPPYEPQTEEAKKWSGFGSALKPAFEPILLARKPLSEETLAKNVLRWGTGALNIDACRVGATKSVPASLSKTENSIYGKGLGGYKQDGTEGGHNPNLGRWPANLILDGSEEVCSLFPHTQSGLLAMHHSRGNKTDIIYGKFKHNEQNQDFGGDAGSAARFFYHAKASKKDRAGSKHPTIKPVSLMRYLVRLITPPGGTVLDCFAGSGTTGQAAIDEGFSAVLIEREEEYIEDIKRRMTKASEEQGATLEGLF